MNFYMNLYMILFLMSCCMFTFYYKHILLTLISLEFMMISLMINIYNNFNMINMNMYFMSFFLTISICESIIGLSTMVFLIRMTGNDYMNMLNIMKW